MLATIVASLLLLQVAFAGAPVAAGDGFGVICSTQTTTSDGEQPVVPHKGHRHGLCCVLHCGALDAPPPKAFASVEAPYFPTQTLVSMQAAPAPLRRMEPKGAPQSPRAPPAFS